jgi:hypothetical protein
VVTVVQQHFVGCETGDADDQSGQVAPQRPAIVDPGFASLSQTHLKRQTQINARTNAQANKHRTKRTHKRTSKQASKQTNTVSQSSAR